MKKLLILLLLVSSCKAQEIPTKIAYEVNAVAHSIGEKNTMFTARNGQILLETKNNDYKKGDEYLLMFEIKGSEGAVLKIEVLHSQESKKQWFIDLNESKELLGKRGYRLEDLLIWQQ